MTEKTKPVLSLADVMVSAKHENAFEFAYLNENGEETPWLISVIGFQAPSVKKAMYEKINKELQQEKFLEKKGKDVPFVPIEERIEKSKEGLAACIVGWRGLEEEYSHELATNILLNNESLAEQVKSASENLANFTKSK